MTFEIALTLTIIGVAVFFFATEKLRVDIIALLVLLTLVITGLLDGDDAFSGFSNPAVITVWAVYIVSAALFKTGITDIIGAWIAKVAGNSEPRLIAIIMLTSGTMSAFMNNIGATAMLLPAVVGISRSSGVKLSKLLIPLAFASLLGGNMTQIGTPPNILATSILTERGLESFGFFDFTPTGIIVFLAGVAYMVFIGRFLLPDRTNVADKQAAQLRKYVTEVRVLPESRLAGVSLADSHLFDEDLAVLDIIHEGDHHKDAYSETIIHKGDLLIVSGDVKSLIEADEKLGLVIEPDFRFRLSDLDTAASHVFEIVLPTSSQFSGFSIRDARLRDRYGFTVMAIWRQGEVLINRLSDVVMQAGDVLLLKGARNSMADLQDNNQVLILEPLEIDRRRRKKAPLALGILGLVLTLTTFAGFHISTAMVIGSVLMVLTGCITMEEAYQNIEWRSVFLIAGMLPLGMVMETTGTAQFLAHGIVEFAGQWGPLAVLAGIYVLAGLITEPMSNAAATVMMVPIAIDIALELGASPQAFVLAVVIGASTSFLTPVGHQSNVLVFGPGGYKFFDFTKVGWLLNLLLVGVTLLVIPLFWPLFP
ncbi:MAG: SLC13 family permease [Anaerolineae bacterium]|jgi:di/tricarboxylate transporter|nr:SLC13 family permease [Anaerolineae bacterium]MBT7070914.1 SLC13 family permease [Anaerolineae bacterium]MBT7324340.1 SLC13 family permease [Anaerolineae bacterium]